MLSGPSYVGSITSCCCCGWVTLTVLYFFTVTLVTTNCHWYNGIGPTCTELERGQAAVGSRSDVRDAALISTMVAIF
jgi:hypothetical protein